MVALPFGGSGLLPGGAGHVLPVGHLQGKAAEAIEVALVIQATGAELAADRQPQQQGEQLSGLPFGAIATTLLGVGHGSDSANW